MSKLPLIFLAAASLFGAPAFAQTSAPMNVNSSSAMTNAQIGNLWRASKLDGVNIYSASDEKIGEIDDVLIDHAGKVMAVVVDVGGFLGIGTHRVALKFEAVKFSDAPRKTADGKAVTTPTTTDIQTAAAVGRMYPDHAVVNMTKEQLKALQQVSYTR